MYSNNSLVPQQQAQNVVNNAGGLLPAQYHHHQSGLHNFPHHQMSMESGMLGVPKIEPNLITPEIDKEKEKQARENHCEIERRRRVKMAAYFNELCVMVPTCNTLQRKPDKLTILRMASSHMRNLRGNHSNTMSNDCAYKPSFLTDQELKHLILEAADGFLFVSQCDTGNIIYVSDAVQSVLSYTPNDWNHRSLLDFVHPEDLDKVKDQLSTQENSSNNTTGRILDLKTGTVKKEGHPNSVRSHIGSRRSFVCRIRLGQQNTASQRPLLDANGSNLPGGSYWSSSNPRINRACLQSTQDSADPNRTNYSVVHITGYTKVWPPSNQANQNQGNAGGAQNSMYHSLDEHGNSSTNFHLIAIARIQMTSAPNDLVNSSNGEFVTRHDQAGIITFADQRVTGLLGIQPSDMLKKSIADFIVPQDQLMFQEQLKTIYETKITQPVQITLHFNTTGGDVIPFSTSAYAFCNPCNDAFEFIVCTHTSQKYSEPKPNSELGQLNNPMTTNSTSHLDAATVAAAQANGQNYYNIQHNLNQANQYTNSSGAYQQHQGEHINYQNQFMHQANNQFGQQQQQPHLSNAPLANTNLNLNPGAQSSYGNYLIMPNANHGQESYSSTSSSSNSSTPTPNTNIEAMALHQRSVQNNLPPNWSSSNSTFE